MTNALTYTRSTRGIEVRVTPHYLEEQSAPDQGRFVWAYHVRIENMGSETVQLLNRFWRITDAVGASQEVRGEGVVGEQPVLIPGGVFEYTSGTPLPTPSGMMMGAYQMETEAGELFDVDVPAFSLDSPHEKVHVH